ncbi:TPA: hypothetical protein N0F65_000135 [Lagenidium giganteum]|uniref:UBA domain-containing protein n=1 Tax=Lagenidium giganteum TaxID=4803 RepID=A0AAV2YYR8_9STRA|nr:TPA: hypothetical protein N0F65_000135 [Lagenidium giganteum]
MHGDLRGLYGAPVTYALSIAVGAASSASLLFNHGKHLTLDRDAVLRRMHYWRLLSSQITFHHGLAISFGLYIIFQFRVLERQMGSRRFGSIVFFVLAVTGVLQLAALLSAPTVARNIPGGPYAVIGALAVFFQKYIPKLQPKAYSVAGMHFSDKSSTYMVLLVLLARNPRTLLAFAPGVFLGILFSSTPFGKLRLPSFLCTVFRLFHPLFEVVPPSAAVLHRQRRIMEAQRRLGLRQNQAGGPPGQGFRDQLLPGGGGLGGMMAPQMAAVLPSEDAIQQLTIWCLENVQALGFDRERSIAALRTTNNNVEAAANRLLNGL